MLGLEYPSLYPPCPCNTLLRWINLRECSKNHVYRAILVENYRRIAQQTDNFKQYLKELVVYISLDNKKLRLISIDNYKYTQIKGMIGHVRGKRIGRRKSRGGAWRQGYVCHGLPWWCPQARTHLYHINITTHSNLTLCEVNCEANVCFHYSSSISSPYLGSSSRNSL